jgi:hypothetical protein
MWLQMEDRSWLNAQYFSRLQVGSITTGYLTKSYCIEGFCHSDRVWETIEDGFISREEAENCLNELMESTQMDKQIRKIEKEVKHSGKDLKKLETADKKRDKVCEMGEKAMKMKKSAKKKK